MFRLKPTAVLAGAPVLHNHLAIIILCVLFAPFPFVNLSKYNPAGKWLTCTASNGANNVVFITLLPEMVNISKVISPLFSIPPTNYTSQKWV